MFTLPPEAMPPARFFYNRFWQRKLVSWGWDYVTAGLLAQDIAEKCHLAPHDIRAMILRDATDRYRFPDPDDVLPIIASVRERRRKRHG